jgi:hypothetical protein
MLVEGRRKRSLMAEEILHRESLQKMLARIGLFPGTLPSSTKAPMKMRTLFALLLATLSTSATAGPAIGVRGSIGPDARAKLVDRLIITEPGIYENYIVDGEWASGNLVKITADDVVLRNCEIRHGSGNGVGVFGTRILIENCHIHHLLAGTFADQRDAHGISGRWGDLTIRNCEISHPSGDCIQFDPDRASNGTVRIEHCTLWTGALLEDIAGFKSGQRPGENAVDTKVKPDGPRCQLMIRDCVIHGWNQPAPIENAAALNLKERVDAEVSRCLFHDNEITFRVRGPGERGGARVTISDCAVYRSETAVRAEDRIERLLLHRIGYGEGVATRLKFVGGKAGPEFEDEGGHDALSMETVLQQGFSAP